METLNEFPVVRNTDFITLYTDASFRVEQSWARIAFRGKCNFGSIQESKEITSIDIHEAEMMAMLFAVQRAIETYPQVIGFFINSDNKHCVEAFWEFKKINVAKVCVPIKQELIKTAGHRWIRTKHVKAHTGRTDVRSYMNRQVDKMTRRG